MLLSVNRKKRKLIKLDLDYSQDNHSCFCFFDYFWKQLRSIFFTKFRSMIFKFRPIILDYLSLDQYFMKFLPILLEF